jgi:hypothetical protein
MSPNKIFLNYYRLAFKEIFSPMDNLQFSESFKPIFWTIRDLWVISGNCVYPIECDRYQHDCSDFPALDRSFEIKQDASALNLKPTFRP